MVAVWPRPFGSVLAGPEHEPLVIGVTLILANVKRTIADSTSRLEVDGHVPRRLEVHGHVLGLRIDLARLVHNIEYDRRSPERFSSVFKRPNAVGFGSPVHRISAAQVRSGSRAPFAQLAYPFPGTGSMPKPMQPLPHAWKSMLPPMPVAPQSGPNSAINRMSDIVPQ
jgi:hypothetical protein